MTSTTIHRARVVLPVSAPPIPDGAVAVRGGRIVDVGTHNDVTARLEREPNVDRVEWEGVMTPGLVNAHTHLQYTDMAEVGRGEYSGFEEWSRSFQVGYTGREHDWRTSAADGAQQLLRSGTTAAADIVTDSAAASALHDAGLHGVAFWEVFGWKTPHWEQDGERLLGEALALVPESPAVGISPHAPYSLGTGVFRGLARFAATHGLRQHIHAAESALEDEYTRSGSGGLADQWRLNGHGDFELLAQGGSGEGAVAYLDSVGALTPTTHLAHGIYVDARDRELLRRRGIAVALCPRSNAVIGLEAPPIAAYLTEGNRIAVGTDSLSSSPSLNVLEDVAALYLAARDQGYREHGLHSRLFEAATLGGAHALGLDVGANATGSLSPGNRADLAVLGTSSDIPADALAEIVETGRTPALATLVAGTIKWSAR